MIRLSTSVMFLFSFSCYSYYLACWIAYFMNEESCTFNFAPNTVLIRWNCCHGDWPERYDIRVSVMIKIQFESGAVHPKIKTCRESTYEIIPIFAGLPFRQQNHKVPTFASVDCGAFNVINSFLFICFLNLFTAPGRHTEGCRWWETISCHCTTYNTGM